jgi:uncharacterized protein YjbI with pentapeptide repeats
MKALTELSDLQGRWTTEILHAANAAIVKQAKAAHTLASSPFGHTPEGCEDYRAFTLRDVLQYISCDNVDFTAMQCDWAGCLSYCTVTNGLFSGAQFNGRFVTANFAGCDFSHSSMKDARLGDKFTDTTFIRCNLTKSVSSQALFERCDFSNANFSKSMFTQCQFFDCTFTGAKFHNASMAGSSFTRCVMDDGCFERTITDQVHRLD